MRAERGRFIAATNPDPNPSTQHTSFPENGIQSYSPFPDPCAPLFPPVHKDYFIYKRPERKSGDLLVPALLRRALSNRASPTQGTLIFHSSTLNYGRGHAIIPGHKESILGKISSIRIFPLIALGGKLKFRKTPAPIIGIFFF